jgi:hypothetical protein
MEYIYNYISETTRVSRVFIIIIINMTEEFEKFTTVEVPRQCPLDLLVKAA